LTARALEALDPVWERDLVSYCYREFALNGSRVSAEELFALNRGALLQAGISLPIEICFNNNAERHGSKFKRALAKAGFVHSKADASAQSRFTLDIAVNTAPVNVAPTGAPPSSSSDGLTIFCELTDNAGVVKPLRRAFPLRSLSYADICAFARALGALAFRVEG